MAEAKSYQQLRSDLDDIVAQLQSGEADVDEAAKLYEQGMKLVKELEKYLKQTEVKIEKIKANHS